MIVRRTVGKKRLNLKELWEYREILFFFALRDMKLRYKFIPFAITWAILQPLLLAIILNISIGKILKNTNQVIYYVEFAFIGLIFWNYFVNSLNRIRSSLLNNSSIINSSSFPRLLIPLSCMFVSLLDFVSALFFFSLLIWNTRSLLQVNNIPYLLLAFLTTFSFSLGLGLIFAILGTLYKDTREFIAFLISILFFLTPVIYPIKIVPKEMHLLLYFNPMVGVIESVRAIFSNSGDLYLPGLILSITTSLLFLAFGVMYFLSKQEQIAEII